MSLFGNKSTAHLGIDIGAHGIKLVELKKSKGRPQLWTYGMMSEKMDIHAEAMDEKPAGETSAEDAPQEQAPSVQAKADGHEDEARIATYAKQLKALLKAANVTSKTATASLPVSQVFHAAITLPPVDKKEIDHHVRAKVKKMLPRPIEEMQVVHQLIPDDEQTKGKKKQFIRVLVTAAPRTVVSFYTKIFTAAGLSLDELETEAFALQRALVGNDMSSVMIIDIGAERSNFFIVDHTVPVSHRSIQVGGDAIDALLAEQLSIPVEKVGQMKHDLARSGHGEVPTELYEELTDPLIKEISYNMEIFSKQTGNEERKIEKIILTGGSSLFPPISDAIKQAFPINVFVGDPWARVVYQQGLKRVLDDIGPRMAVSIGLALRNVVDSKQV